MNRTPRRIPSIVATALVAAIGIGAGALLPSASLAKPAARARVGMKAARATALAKVPGGKIQSAELEREHGRQIYSLDIRIPGKPGIEEVQVDAKSGEVVSMTHESPKAERTEALQETQEHKGGVKSK